MKILVIRFSSIGDIVLTSPVVRCIKTQIPNAEIHYCTKGKFKFLVDSNPNIDKVFGLEDSFSDLLDQLKGENYDLVIDLHNNLRTLRIRWALRKSQIRVFQKWNFAKWILVKFKKDFLPKLHIVQRYVDTCKDFGVTYDGKGLDFFVPNNIEIPEQVKKLLPKPPFVVFVSGGTWATKRLPVEKMRDLFEKSQAPLVVLGDQNDGVSVSEACAGLESKVINLCGALSLMQCAEIMKLSSLIISHDTGLMHIAAAIRKPIISIWGNTVPEFGMTPIYPNVEPQPYSFISEVKNLPCRPCSKIGFNACPRGHFKCMLQQDFNAMASEINNVLDVKE